MDAPGDEMIMRKSDKPGVTGHSPYTAPPSSTDPAQNVCGAAQPGTLACAYSQPDVGIELELFMNIPPGSGIAIRN